MNSAAEESGRTRFAVRNAEARREKLARQCRATAAGRNRPSNRKVNGPKDLSSIINVRRNTVKFCSGKKMGWSEGTNTEAVSVLTGG